MEREGIIGNYAIGGAVGATFYLEPVATLDLDVFVLFSNAAESLLISLTPIYEYLLQKGHQVQGEYIQMSGWPVQFLPPAGDLEEEAISQARELRVNEIMVRVMTPEHLIAIALKVGRAKDFSRILQFIEGGAFDVALLDDILKRHCLLAKWEKFGQRFLNDEPL